MAKDNEKVNVKKEIWEWIYCIIIAIVVALLIRYFIFTPTMIKQTSMVPTLQEGERVFLSRMMRNFDEMPERGDIIIFEMPDGHPSDNQLPIAYYNSHDGLLDKFNRYFLELGKISYIKRVIGLPGEHLQIIEGQVYINGEVIEETYLVEGLETGTMDGEYCDVIIPEDCIFAMGDNRNGSMDSRVFGCIPLYKIEGEVLFRIWPLNKFGDIDK
ncbi:MAG: signal peptidase I [Clostridia bacterium]|nr:signal peptidase I [Clostridia bacterium]